MEPKAEVLTDSEAASLNRLPAAARYDAAAANKNMAQLIQLRWIAVLGQVITIAVVEWWVGIPLPINAMIIAVMGLVLFNVISIGLLRRRRRITEVELFVALLVDVAALTVQLYFSGGAANPFALLYLLQISLGAALLQTRAVWSLVVITSFCLVGLSLFSTPLVWPSLQNEAPFNLYTVGLIICFVLVATLLVVFISRINRNLRERDARLADLRQRAIEEEHIVRMGLMASGAAHELGTPLATLAVILGDWKRIPSVTAQADLLQDVDEMQRQVQRCKHIVSGILLAAGEARGEALEATTLSRFLENVVAEWRRNRSAENVLVYEKRFGEDVPMFADSVLKQMLGNLLDNAYEASPNWLSLTAAHDGETLVLTVHDHGQGFSVDMLKHIGKPYHSTKGRPGGGLGLFLSSNVARTLGGFLTARNSPEGGAVVSVRLPLAAISRVDEND